MNPILNPYSPGAGTPPPELAGRDDLREQLRISIARLRLGKPSKSILLLGLRGVGKTVLLNRISRDADAEGVHTAQIEAQENQSLPAMLAPSIRLLLLRLSRAKAAQEWAVTGLRALAGFVKSLKVTFSDIEVGIDYEPKAGLADNGDLEADLTALLQQVGIAAQRAETAFVMFIDELQYVKEAQLSALISALHRCAQDQLPVTVIGAGLPQLRASTGKAKSYAERLFDFRQVGPLSLVDAARAIIKPAEAEGVGFENAAIEVIMRATKGYPYFLQEWGKHAWDAAEKSPITQQDAQQASSLAIAALDESFFAVRFDRLSPAERKYLRGMAELGEGPHRSGDIAEQLRKNVTSLGPLRNNLISKGMIWSPNHGETAFTVPLFDEFMRRRMPGLNEP